MSLDKEVGDVEEEEEGDAEKKDESSTQKIKRQVQEWELLNKNKAIWLRDSSTVSTE